MLAFLGLVVCLSVPFWVLDAAAGRLPSWLPDNLPTSALQAFCPLIAAAVLVMRADGLAGLRRLLTRTIDPGRNPRRAWYVPAVLVFPIVMLPLSIAAMHALGRPLPDAEFALATLPVLVVVFAISAAGEEAGWTAYALEPMRRRWGTLGAALLLGGFGALWHAVPYVQGGNDASWIAGQFLFTVAARVVIVWLYVATGGGVLAAVVAHTMSNVSWTLFPNKGSHYDPVVTGVLTAVLACVLVAVGWRTVRR